MRRKKTIRELTVSEIRRERDSIEKNLLAGDVMGVQSEREKLVNRHRDLSEEIVRRVRGGKHSLLKRIAKKISGK